MVHKTSSYFLLTQVTFKNETTGEYLFYNLNFKATAPGVISTIEMATRVRQMASGSVEVENPLLLDVSFSAECQNADICVPPQFLVPAQSKVDELFFKNTELISMRPQSHIGMQGSGNFCE